LALGPVPHTSIVIAGIDVDACYDGGVLDARVQKVLKVANSYAEKSPSGRGIHILGIGDIGTTKTKRGAVGLRNL
jgi:primase-polymerase (primpol)-like protein